MNTQWTGCSVFHCIVDKHCVDKHIMYMCLSTPTQHKSTEPRNSENYKQKLCQHHQHRTEGAPYSCRAQGLTQSMDSSAQAVKHQSRGKREMTSENPDRGLCRYQRQGCLSRQSAVTRAKDRQTHSVHRAAQELHSNHGSLCLFVGLFVLVL